MENEFKKLKFSFLPIPEEIMLSKALSFGAKLLFGIIAKTNFERVKFTKRYLAKRMGCSLREVQRRIRELRENELIIVHKDPGKANEYQINFQLIRLIQTPVQLDQRPQLSGGGDNIGPTNNKENIKRNIYIKKKNKFLKKTEMVSHQERAQIQEEVAPELRKRNRPP